MTEILQSVLNICPSCNNRAEDHQAKREKGHARNRSTKPEHLAVGDQDDRQVLENGIDRDGEKLKRLCAGVNHHNEGQGYGKPCIVVNFGDNSTPSGVPTFPCLIGIEVSISDYPKTLTSLDSNHTHYRLIPVSYPVNPKPHNA